MSVVPQAEPLAGHHFGLIADAHVHPGRTPPLPAALAEIFARVDRILALGDMGEASGLDALEKIAPLSAVAGEDDEPGDARLRPLRLFSCGELNIAALFDGVKHELFQSSDPISPRADFASAVVRKFGRKPDILLCASTHKPFVARASGILVVNPGSPTLADQCSVAILHVENSAAWVETIVL